MPARSVQPHSPVVTPALAQAIEAGMMLRAARGRAYEILECGGDRFGVARRPPGVEPRDLVALGLMRHGHDRIVAAGQRRGFGFEITVDADDDCSLRSIASSRAVLHLDELLFHVPISTAATAPPMASMCSSSSLGLGLERLDLARDLAEPSKISP